MSKIYLYTGLVLMALGGLIWKFKIVELLRMYDARTCKDKDGLARWTGRSLVLAGLISVLAAWSPLPELQGKLPLWLYLALIIGVFVLAALGNRKYS